MDSQGTTAREERHCVELTLSGQPCRSKPVAERDRCYIHGLFRALNDGRCTIDVPLLEDEESILFVYSQVARALAQGSMPAANAGGIIRCCRGAQRLLEEKRKRERAEQRKKTEDRRQESESAQPAANPLAKDQQGQTDAAVPPNVDNCEQTGCPIASPEQTADGAESNGSPVVGDMGASADPPQPWTVEPVKKVIPPPQFANARKKYDDTLARIGGDMTTALIQRNREVGARGGKYLEGVICDIRDTWSTHTDSTQTGSTPGQTTEPLSS